MSRLIHLARHGTHAEVGRVLSGRSEIALNEQGIVEAERLAALIGSLPVTSIHSSPRRRALQTIEPAARRTGLPVTIAPALDEVDFGAFTGQTFAGLNGDGGGDAWFRWNAERDSARCPDGETMAEAVARAAAYLQALPEPATPAFCVTHCDVIRGLVAQALGLRFQSMFAFDCDPGSLTTLDLSNGQVRLVALNERPR
jgi:ribonuclease H / adenosylcobalamin/alpha-ribazole phosphatase